MSAPHGSANTAVGFFPFGYPVSAAYPTGLPNHKLSEITAAPMVSAWYIADADCVAFPTGWDVNMDKPAKPVHGSVRTYFYFDGHVSTRKVNPVGAL